MLITTKEVKKLNDIRDTLFFKIKEKKFSAVLTAERCGILSGVNVAYTVADEIGVSLKICKKEGDLLNHNEVFAHLTGTPKQIAIAEECLIGTLAKASGIATAASTAVQLANHHFTICSGSWKKMPMEIKHLVRSAVVAGGATFRICNQPMVYIDKNFIRMFGSIPAAIQACQTFPDSKIVMQIKGLTGTIEEETKMALRGNCHTLMIDTGKLEDVRCCYDTVLKCGKAGKVVIGYAKGIRIRDIPELINEPIDVLCIGKEIVDAPLLDMKLDVVQEEATL